MWKIDRENKCCRGDPYGRDSETLIEYNPYLLFFKNNILALLSLI